MNSLTSSLALGVLAVLSAPARGSEYDPEATARDEISHARLLCDWQKEHAPSGNPVPLTYCTQAVPENEIRAQAMAWWRYWYQRDDTAAARLQMAFNSAWEVSHRQHQCQRTEFNAANWRLIEAKQIQIGMSEAALRCSWGRPRQVNRTVIGNRVSSQYVYGEGNDETLVYVEDGRVTSYQDTRR